jgi:hypothetical protein
MLDKCPVSAWSEVAQIIKEDLGQPPEVLFKEFSHTPIASASLAQVILAWHAALLYQEVPCGVGSCMRSSIWPPTAYRQWSSNAMPIIGCGSNCTAAHLGNGWALPC